MQFCKDCKYVKKREYSGVESGVYWKCNKDQETLPERYNPVTGSLILPDLPYCTQVRGKDSCSFYKERASVWARVKTLWEGNK